MAYGHGVESVNPQLFDIIHNITKMSEHRFWAKKELIYWSKRVPNQL